MTCIVGISEGGKVYIGGDSAGVSRYSLQVRADRKVFLNEGIAFGFTTSFRMGQLLNHALKPPRRYPDVDITKWMVTDFVNAIRDCLKVGGWAAKKEEVEEGGHFLVGYEGKLFGIHEDYQVSEAIEGFDAAGCGEDFARGVLHATVGMEPRARILHALAITERCCAGVRAPFYLVETGMASGTPPSPPEPKRRGAR